MWLHLSHFWAFATDLTLATAGQDRLFPGERVRKVMALTIGVFALRLHVRQADFRRVPRKSHDLAPDFLGPLQQAAPASRSVRSRRRGMSNSRFP